MASLQVPFLDLPANYQSIKNEVLKEILDVLDTSAYILGKKVSDFEEEFARRHAVGHCVGLSSGTDANHLALWALGIQPGDEVIMPANTFIATAWGATLCGATPVFADCEKDSYNLSPASVEARITSKTKAIVAVHLYGQPADLDPLRLIAKKNGLYFLEDAAQAHMAEYKGVPVGGLSDIASFSFYPGKNLGAYGEGGAITTQNNTLAERCMLIRSHGAHQKYSHVALGHNYRMEGIQGAVLRVKLRHLARWTDARRKVAAMYRERLRNLPDLVLPEEMPYAKHVYHLYVVQTSRRDALQKALTEKGIGSGLHYPIPLHLQECFRNLGYKRGEFPVSEKLADQCISLPIFPELTESQIDYLTDAVRSFFNSRSN